MVFTCIWSALVPFDSKWIDSQIVYDSRLIHIWTGCKPARGGREREGERQWVKWRGQTSRKNIAFYKFVRRGKICVLFHSIHFFRKKRFLLLFFVFFWAVRVCAPLLYFIRGPVHLFLSISFVNYVSWRAFAVCALEKIFSCFRPRAHTLRNLKDVE